MGDRFEVSWQSKAAQSVSNKMIVRGNGYTLGPVAKHQISKIRFSFTINNIVLLVNTVNKRQLRVKCY